MPVSAYVANTSSNNVSVIDTVTLTLTTTIAVGRGPCGVCVTPDLTKAYVSNSTDGTVSVIQTSTNTVVHTTTVGTDPGGIAVTPDGTKFLVANFNFGPGLGRLGCHQCSNRDNHSPIAWRRVDQSLVTLYLPRLIHRLCHLRDEYGNDER